MEENIRKILHSVDHTLLDPAATWPQIAALCDDAIEYETASVCIPPAFVSRAKAYVGREMPVCTVIGFPNGYSSTAVKVFEAGDAIQAGADEIDMVINLGWVKDQHWEDLTREIREVREACRGRILKVIVETCLLTDVEKIRMCHVVSEAGADYIKTSTGFSTGGATFEDVSLLAAYVSDNVKIKAAGGIATLEDAARFLSLGASRLGTSRIVKLVKAMEAENG